MPQPLPPTPHAYHAAQAQAHQRPPPPQHPHHPQNIQHAPLPPGWQAQWDHSAQRNLFIESATGRTTWQHPALPPHVPHHPSVQQQQQQQHAQAQHQQQQAAAVAAAAQRRKVKAESAQLYTGGALGGYDPNAPPPPQPPSHQQLPPQGDGMGREGAGGSAGGGGPPTGGPSDFVKKLYMMLEDTSYAHIVGWTPSGDSFVVKEMNDFTRHILPRHFKHSNFASFVRQLNKYDFHKVKREEGEERPWGDQTWEFKHPEFKANQRHLLENIRRKAPTGKKPTAQGTPGPADGGPPASGHDVAGLRSQLDSLARMQQEMYTHIGGLQRNYQGVIGEMLNFQKNLVAQDQLMQSLIQYLVNLEADSKSHDKDTAQTGETPFVPSDQAQKLIASYTEVARASFAQMNEISRRAASIDGFGPTPEQQQLFDPSWQLGGGGATTSAASTSSIPGTAPPTGSKGKERATGESPASTGTTVSSVDRSAGADPLARPGTAGDSPSPANGAQQQSKPPPAPFFMHPPHDQSAAVGGFGGGDVPNGNGLRVFTVGHLRPRTDDDSGATNSSSYAYAPDELAPGSTASTSAIPASAVPAPAGQPPSPGQQTLRVRRSTFVPGWAVPPRVLLVEDDAVCRKLSSKFLQVFGCTIDVAVDGVSAVNKMNLEKYDLVLMDIVMPNLDGVSATSLIRQFDPMTPIISMTSNSNPNEILNYFSHGMNDILPKPFTKEGLLGMLEKHLIHLKTMQQLSEIPRALGLPPLSDQALSEALTHGALSLPSAEGGGAGAGGSNPGDEETVNPLAGMGFSDDHYMSMLHGILASGAMDGSPSSTTSNSPIPNATKRSWDGGPGGAGEDGPEGKRGRFEIIE